ncbi:MAG TPA: carbohydrate ABC transporter permease [Candidatus Caccomorpha excrementavium]|mgnify:CR=1 FL=1|nr:carbohydrate ABC transporter permease [Candidatus Caccomorpha excrementavium]
MKKIKVGDLIFRIINTCLMLFVIVITIYPFWNQLILSFADREYLYAVEAQWYPKSFNLASYQVILKYKDIWIGYANTIIRTVIGTFLGLLVTAMASYPLTKKDFPGNKVLTFLILFTMLFSGGLIPSYLLMTQQLHLTNSIWALILPSLATPYNIFIMRNFFLSVPDSLEESARIDGAGYFRIFWQLIVPLSKPVLVTVGLWIAVGHWQAWYDNLLYLQDPDQWGLQMILREILVSNQQTNIYQAVRSTFGSAGAVDERQLKSAIIVVSILPMIIVYPFLQKFMHKGIILGAVKG